MLVSVNCASAGELLVLRRTAGQVTAQTVESVSAVVTRVENDIRVDKIGIDAEPHRVRAADDGVVVHELNAPVGELVTDVAVTETCGLRPVDGDGLDRVAVAHRYSGPISGVPRAEFAGCLSRPTN